MVTYTPSQLYVREYLAANIKDSEAGGINRALIKERNTKPTNCSSINLGLLTQRQQTTFSSHFMKRPTLSYQILPHRARLHTAHTHSSHSRLSQWMKECTQGRTGWAATD